MGQRSVVSGLLLGAMGLASCANDPMESTVQAGRGTAGANLIISP